MAIEPSGSIQRLTAHVRGRVQGVGFRVFAQREAARVGVAGYVLNARDGSVEVVAEGQRDALEQLLGRLRQGPPGARVRDVDVEWASAVGQFTRFQIRHEGR